MKVSVIVPNYNHAKFLNQRIESIINQTYQDFEVIILDDCSPDNSREIIEVFRNHPKVSHIVYNEINSGSPFKQWEKGIELAEGDWVWVAESDDWCEPSLLENLVNGIIEGSTISFCQSLIVRDNGQVIRNSTAKNFEQNLDGTTFVKKHMLNGNMIINASMCIFKRSTFYKVQSDFTSFKFCGDWVFWIEIALQGSVFITAKILNYFRKHDKDVSGKAFNSGVYYLEYIRIVNYLLERRIITVSEKREHMANMFMRFLNDGAVNKKVRKDIQAAFRVHLHNKVNQICFKYKTAQFKRNARQLILKMGL